MVEQRLPLCVDVTFFEIFAFLDFILVNLGHFGAAFVLAVRLCGL